jgi:hypothetical protein
MRPLRSPELPRQLAARVIWLVLIGLALLPAVQAPLMYVYYALVAVGVAVWSTCPPVRAWLERIDLSGDDAVAARDEPRALLAGLAVVAFALVLLEARAPLYFTQDDNLAQFAPVMMHGVRSFFAGVFPTWNPYQLLGAPTTCVGTYALTYPPTYLAFGLANLVGRPNAGLEVFCVLHVVLGYVVSQRVLLKSFGTDPWVAALSAAAYVLSGYELVCGRSWYYMVPLVLWVPLTTHALFSFVKAPSARLAVQLGLVLGIFFHAGNAQMWVYAACLVAVAIALVAGFGPMNRPARRRLLGLSALAFAAMLVVAAPLLVSQMRFTGDIERHAWGEGIGKGLAALFLPYPLVVAPLPNDWWRDGDYARYAGQFYFSGTAQVLAAFAFGLVLARRAALGKNPRGLFARPMGLAFALLLLTLSVGMGPGGWPWGAMQVLPVFHKFSSPFKMMGFITWLLALLGAFTLSQVVRVVRGSSWSRWGMRALVAFLVVPTLWHVWFARSSFHTYGVVPYPSLPPALAAVAPHVGRLVTLTPVRSPKPGYGDTLPHNLPTVYGLSSLEGYDPLVADKPESAFDRSDRTWAEYGVDTVLVTTEWTGHADVEEIVRRNRLRKLGETPNVIVYALDGAKPLAFAADPSTAVEGLALRADGVRVGAKVTRAGGDRVTLNFLARRGMAVTLDDGPAVMGKDALRRIVVDVPSGEHRVAVVYDGAWKYGGYLVVFALALAMAWVARTFLARG